MERQTHMTPEDFKAIRQRLGLSLNELAGALGLSDKRTVDEIERGKRACSGPVAKLMRLWDAGRAEPSEFS